MKLQFKREIAVIGYFLLFFLLGLTILMVFCEFLFGPLIDWILTGASYHFPSLDELYKWGKLIVIVVPPLSILMWIYVKINEPR